jgi:hypothetical protein
MVIIRNPWIPASAGMTTEGNKAWNVELET